MTNPDVEKERSERLLTITDFLTLYNEDLPKRFPRASVALLEEFRHTNPSLFKGKKHWTLGQHRKKVMDWLPQHTIKAKDDKESS